MLLKGILIDHLRNVPLPLPILEFFDFFVMGKFPNKKNQKVNSIFKEYFDFKKFLKNFLKIKI